MEIARPRRSALYVPASSARAIEKARSLSADVIILDLEDAVSPEAKPSARNAAIAAVKRGGFGHREVVIRTNGLDTPWGSEDLAAAAQASPDAILVPKVSNACDIARYDVATSAAPRKTRLWSMIETASAVFHLWDIAASAKTTRLSAWVMGVNDLAGEMRTNETPARDAMLPILTLAVAAARAHQLVVLDGVHNDIENLETLAQVCRQGADLGFDGKTLIHPKHLEICNAAFSPSSDELAWSNNVIDAFAAPESVGKGVLRVEGKMVERLHLAQAMRLVAIDRSIRYINYASN
ncbi:CoA ester lyase [Bradyrhizobium sp. Leo121]|uniref:HpcH/HpaI aldolase/citrate lyase family protein n=1 Tax=Bradyrhizobium sp. Leo121 TaxID=1571195 RepID=UPI0010292CF0|nr:CoA ester lyase [Bradyrhizobium sp. Leo121]RZN31460.1 CoA ester lyase [Bradyrhizobium sp. Leo121]